MCLGGAPGRSCLGAVYSLMEGFNLVLQVRIDFFYLGQEMTTMRLQVLPYKLWEVERHVKSVAVTLYYDALPV